MQTDDVQDINGLEPEAAMTHARLPTELPTRTVGLLTTSSKKSRINCLTQHIHHCFLYMRRSCFEVTFLKQISWEYGNSSNIRQYVNEFHVYFRLKSKHTHLSPCLHRVRKPGRLVGGAKPQQIDRVDGVRFRQHANVPTDELTN